MTMKIVGSKRCSAAAKTKDTSNINVSSEFIPQWILVTSNSSCRSPRIDTIPFLVRLGCSDCFCDLVEGHRYTLPGNNEWSNYKDKIYTVVSA